MFSLYFGKTQGKTISQNYHYCCKNGLELVALLPKLLMDSTNKPDTQRCFMESRPCCSSNVDKFTLKRAAKDFFFSKGAQ